MALYGKNETKDALSAVCIFFIKNYCYALPCYFMAAFAFSDSIK